MNKTININLGGYAFIIDEDAFQNLGNYLAALKKHFSKSESCQEIMNDLEARFGELLESKIQGRTIVTIGDVETTINTMGKLEDYGLTEEEINEGKSAPSSSSYNPGDPIRKRLYRNPEDEMIGGVCSGLTAYFGWNDPTWVRIGWVAAVFLWGFGFWAYLLLWAILPKARTTAEKLEMRGEAPTLERIAKAVEEEVNRLDSKFNSPRTKEYWHKGMTTVKSNSKNLFLGIIFIMAITALIGIYTGGLAIYHSTEVIADFLLESRFDAWMIFISGILLCMIPIAGLIARLVFSFKETKAPSYLWVSLVVAWVFFLFVFITFIFSQSKTFFHRNEVNETQSLSGITADTITIRAEAPISNVFHGSPFIHNYRMVESSLILGDVVDINIHEDDTATEPYAIIHRISHGKSPEQALELSKAIQFELKQVGGNKIMVPVDLSIPQGQKFRRQHVHIKFMIPKGKKVKLENQRGLLQIWEFDDTVNAKLKPESKKRIDIERELEKQQKKMDEENQKLDELRQKLDEAEDNEI